MLSKAVLVLFAVAHTMARHQIFRDDPHIHTDVPLAPIATAVGTGEDCTNPAATSTATLADLAVDTPELSTLVVALKAADLVTALGGPGPFTVVAPDNAAFAKLAPALLDWLLQPENFESLQQVLLYHVHNGLISSADVVNGQRISTLEGTDVTFTIEGCDGCEEIYKVNRATVISPDANACNGVAHIINEVLIPRQVRRKYEEARWQALQAAIEAQAAMDAMMQEHNTAQDAQIKDLQEKCKAQEAQIKDLQENLHLLVKHLHHHR